MLKIIWEQTFTDITDPLQAAKQAAKDIANGDSVQFTVINDKTGKKYSVDLSEPDEDAVLEIQDLLDKYAELENEKDALLIKISKIQGKLWNPDSKVEFNGMETIHVKETGRYKDGGTTTYISTDGEGVVYWKDGRIGSKTKDKIYNKYPGDKDAIMLNVNLIIE